MGLGLAYSSAVEPEQTDLQDFPCVAGKAYSNPRNRQNVLATVQAYYDGIRTIGLKETDFKLHVGDTSLIVFLRAKETKYRLDDFVRKRFESVDFLGEPQSQKLAGLSHG